MAPGKTPAPAARRGMALIDAGTKSQFSDSQLDFQRRAFPAFSTTGRTLSILFSRSGARAARPRVSKNLTRRPRTIKSPRPLDSGTEVTAIQTLARLRMSQRTSRSVVECGGPPPLSCARGDYEPPKARARSIAVLKSPQSKRWRDCGWASEPRGASAHSPPLSCAHRPHESSEILHR